MFGQHNTQQSGVPQMRALIVGGSPKKPSVELVQALAMQSHYIVAADAGAKACYESKVRIDALVGDLDSVSTEALEYAKSCGALILKYDEHKDETDLELALRHVKDVAKARGEKPYLVCTGILGGRLDHELAALGSIAHEYMLEPCIEEDSMTAYILHEDARSRFVATSRDIGRTLSVIALAENTVVSENGMEWNLQNRHVELLSDLGVSNIVNQSGAYVEVSSGIAPVTVLREAIKKQLHKLRNY